MARRTQVTATIYDADGFPFICIKGNPQDVADCASIYVTNVANPLGGDPLHEFIHKRDHEEEGP